MTPPQYNIATKRGVVKVQAIDFYAKTILRLYLASAAR